MALIRYPGSKEKLARDLWGMFPDSIIYPLYSQRTEYREPFFGAGAIGFRILGELDRRCRVWLNDADEDLVLLWSSVKDSPNQLCRLVMDFTPTVDSFYDFKARDGVADCTDIERGFRKLALHRMSVSGFGVKSGGPIGGRSQLSSKYTVGCRWTPERIKRDIQRLSKRLNKFRLLKLTCGDFGRLVSTAGDDCFLYLDPPYYAKGRQLYRFSMEDACHERLSKLLQNTNARWVLSYDDHPRIRELYSWASFHEMHIVYTNAVTSGLKRPKNMEVAIVPN